MISVELGSIARQRELDMLRRISEVIYDRSQVQS